MISAAIEEALPLVSVIIPAYNAERFIRQTLESVVAQTYRNIEILVVDDGSQDQTAEIVREFTKRDDRIILLTQSNSGVAAARNLAIQHSKGEFIAPIDADDLWHPENIEKQIKCALEGGPSVGVVYSWSIYLDEAGVPIAGFRAFSIANDVFQTLICHNFLGNASASLIRSACLKRVGAYNTEFRDKKAQGCEDWDLYLRLAEYYQFRVVPEFLVGYRKLPNSMSRDYTTMANSCCLMLKKIRQKHPEIPNFLFRFSIGSFFLYLAYECDRARDYKTALLWLRRALQSDPITPFIRLSSYRLIISSAWRLLIAPPSAEPHPQLSVSSQNVDSFSHADWKVKQKIRIQLMVLIGNLFHWFVLLIASNSYSRETVIASEEYESS